MKWVMAYIAIGSCVTAWRAYRGDDEAMGIGIAWPLFPIIALGLAASFAPFSPFFAANWLGKRAASRIEARSDETVKRGSARRAKAGKDAQGGSHEHP